MHKLFFMLLLLLLQVSATNVAMAQDGWWVTNQTKVGFKQIFVGVQVAIKELDRIRFNLDGGLKLKLDDNWDLEPKYILKLPRFRKESYEHQFRISLKLTFK